MLHRQLAPRTYRDGHGETGRDGIRPGVDKQCRLIDMAGDIHSGLYAVGPLTRGVFWEVVAVPDIRNQVAKVSDDVRRRLQAAAADRRPIPDIFSDKTER